MQELKNVTSHTPFLRKIVKDMSREQGTKALWNTEEPLKGDPDEKTSEEDQVSDPSTLDQDDSQGSGRPLQ
jgi:hypothetical protein